MNDFNMVNVESQSQVGKSFDTIKVQSLKMGLQDDAKLLPILKELQNTSSKIVRQFDDYLTKKDRKIASLPYNMIRKFETLKKQFYQSSQVLNLQTNFYNTNVRNRDYEKLHEQLFFKRTMKSYDEKRLWMKNYILKNQSKMQVIEQQVKKDVEYETHRFTQIRNQLNIERLEHNYQDKIDLMNRNQAELKLNTLLKNKIRQKLISIANNRINKVEIIGKRQDNQGKNSHKQSSKQVGTIGKLTRIPSYTNFLYFRLTKQSLRQQYLLSETISLKKLNKRLSHYNKQIKIALDKLYQKVQFSNSQAIIIFHNLLDISNGINNQSRVMHKSKVTKTDYFIYLKEIQRHCNQIIQIYGFYFQYSLLNLSYPNKKKSKSASKVYKIKPTNKQAKNYSTKTFMKDVKSYWQANKDQILKQKQERQQQRRAQAQRNELVLKSLTQSASIQCQKKERQIKQDNSLKQVINLDKLEGGSQNKSNQANLNTQAKEQKQNIKQILPKYTQIQLQEQQFNQI